MQARASVLINCPVETVFAFSEKQQHEIAVDDTTACLFRFAGGVTTFAR
mgnify:CR=1 FL=1